MFPNNEVYGLKAYIDQFVTKFEMLISIETRIKARRLFKTFPPSCYHLKETYSKYSTNNHTKYYYDI